MTVKVFLGDVEVDEVTFTEEVDAVEFASELQDRGYKVRLQQQYNR